jgi:V-type H+-transporting ATPase subunit a
MRHGTLIVPLENARFYLDQLAQEFQIEFEQHSLGADNSILVQSSNSHFKEQVLLVDECEKKLKYIFERLSSLFESHLSQQESLAPPTTSLRESLIDQFLSEKTPEFRTVQISVNKIFDELLAACNKSASIEKAIAKLLDEMEVLKLALEMLDGSSSQQTLQTPLLSSSDKLLTAVAGVVQTNELLRLQKTILRATRGNCYFTSNEATTGETGAGSHKSKFVVFVQGNESAFLRERVMKICIAFDVSVFAWPTSRQEGLFRLSKLQREYTEAVNDSETLKNFYLDMLHSSLSPCHELSVIDRFRLSVVKEKNLLAVLSQFQGKVNTLRCDCWFEEEKITDIQTMLAVTSGSIGGQSATLLVDLALNLSAIDFSGHGGTTTPIPPTLIKRNILTTVFQDLVDTYGLPRYKEINPAIFTVVSFPFIFGVMYGDIGHGAILLALGIFLCTRNQNHIKQASDTLLVFLQLKYLILLMGFFSVFAGFMYNDFLSMGTRLFGTSRFHINDTTGESSFVPWFNNRNVKSTQSESGGPYPFGLDPAWHGASNELLFVNSYKMKLSVLIGVSQMFLGIILKFLNSFHFRNYIDFVFECIPQLTFLIVIFVYMDWMIMYKWVTDISSDPQLNGPPSIINTLINMGLQQTENQPLYSNQSSFQMNLGLCALIAIPLMLIPKPILLLFKHKREQRHDGHGHAHGHGYEKLIEEGNNHRDTHHEDGGFNFAEICIHQIIETIEFVLGTVSHASSYLRQWALSLAHQQLALVFFDKIMTPALSGGNPLSIYISFSIFAMVTTGVLLGMDVLECFLHTLRLHWVEFQSKFYKADGRAFKGYTHKAVLKGSD